MSGGGVLKGHPPGKAIALAGNPNVGKSTVFNALTGLRQHTGNWSGKTVSNARGRHRYNDVAYIIVDLPGTYSLMAHSAEEEATRDFLLFGESDAVIALCDATCLERSLNLALQIIELCPEVVVCVNLMDEAFKKGIDIDIEALEGRLGVPVVGVSAREGKGLRELIERVAASYHSSGRITVRYPKPVEDGICLIAPSVEAAFEGKINPRWLALRIMEDDREIIEKINKEFGVDIESAVGGELLYVKESLSRSGYDAAALRDAAASAFIRLSESVCEGVVSYQKGRYRPFDRKLDRILTGRLTGIPIMLALLCVVFWLTLSGANYPSQLLFDGFFYIQDGLLDFLIEAGAPYWIYAPLILGVLRVLAWVVAVMLPPMAIFFPLFTLLEDFGYLPRVAFNLDHHFKKACACGKQCLCMCMGLGCNAAGVTSCRIIDSPRERLIAILTNSFIPCNGRFPTLIAIISMFLCGAATSPFSSLLSTVILTGVIALGVLMTFVVSKLLSMTVLKGVPSSFTLELPPFRRPQIGKVIIRSILDRTIFVLGRAVAVAAPAGLIIWIMANIYVGDASLLSLCAGFLDPFARLFGLDGVILMAFILGFPANEIVMPIIVMAYMATGTISDLGTLSALKGLLVSNGWTWITAVSSMLFCLVHWPCSTTCLTIKKETGSVKWTVLAVALPTFVGLFVCYIFSGLMRLFGLG